MAEIMDIDGNSTNSQIVFFGYRGRHIVMGARYSSGTNTINYHTMLLDPSTLKTVYLNAEKLTVATGTNNIFHYEKLTEGLYINVNAGTGTFIIKPAIDPCMLMTVNNLSAPVEKTAAQSMKVTYTITET